MVHISIGSDLELKQTLTDNTNTMIGLLGDAAVYLGFIKDYTGDTYSLLNNLSKNAGNYASTTLRVVIATNQPTLPTREQNITNIAVSNFQKTITTSATQLTSIKPEKMAILKALSTNAVPVFIGDSAVTTGTGYELSPGETIYVPISDTKYLYGRVTAGTAVVTVVGV